MIFRLSRINSIATSFKDESTASRAVGDIGVYGARLRYRGRWTLGCVSCRWVFWSVQLESEGSTVAISTSVSSTGNRTECAVGGDCGRRRRESRDASRGMTIVEGELLVRERGRRPLVFLKTDEAGLKITFSLLSINVEEVG